MVTYPIPVPEGTPPWIGVLFVIGGVAVFTVVLLQTVRYFRDHRDED